MTEADDASQSSNPESGDIISIEIAFPDQYRPENKYMVVVGQDGDKYLLLKIGSRVRFVQQRRRLREAHFRIRTRDYPFLEHDSYLNCGTVWHFLTVREVMHQLQSEPGRKVGAVTEPHRNEIIRLMEQSKSISPRHKRIVREALS